MRVGVILFLSLIVGSTAFAQDWIQTPGPGGEAIKSIAVTPEDHLFVVSRVVLRSVDRGKSWIRTAATFPIDSVVSVHSERAGLIYLVVSTKASWDDRN